MRKILVLFTMITLTTCWVSCSDNEDEEIPPVEEETPADNSQEDTVIYKVIMEAEISDATPVKIEVKGKGNKKANLKIDWGDNQTSSDLFIIEKEHQYRKVGLYTITLTGNDITSLSISGPFTSLNTSQCTCLEELDVSSTNPISVDVSKNTNLTSLDCSGNQLASLDVSNNHELRNLYCSDNLLTSLDLSNNHELRRLFCQQNQLTSLDVSNCNKLIHVFCENNQLVALDVSNKQELQYLACGMNKLTSLNLDNTTKIEHLNCVGNLLTTLDLSTNVKLREVNIIENSFSGEALNYLFHTLPLVYDGSARIDINGGSACDKSIATARGWQVEEYYPNPRDIKHL
ncbi:MAG: hypothetical protein SOY65_02260 [Marinifilaceae bacterium]|nr:hypothetical protein [Marinifilaceae bacterium]